MDGLQKLEGKATFRRGGCTRFSSGEQHRWETAPQPGSSCDLRRVFVLLGAAAVVLLFATGALAERIFFAGYKGGFYIKSEEEGGMELRLGGTFEADYRYYFEENRTDNRFDVRRARLIFNGQLTRWFRYGMEFEFQGNETDNLVDAFGEFVSGSHGLRLGQFKEPFGLEWQTANKALPFAERSMGYYLGPRRDVGLMLHGSAFSENLFYAVGLFNGKGDDGATATSRKDSPEFAGRLVVRPFGRLDNDWLSSLQIGGAATYSRIDTQQVDVKVKSSGMAGLSRNIYVLSANTKFGVLQDADLRWRTGAEMAWSKGPVGVMAEWVWLHLDGLKPSGDPPRDADFTNTYGAVLWSVTGEPILLTGGVLQRVYPERFFDPAAGTYGAVCIAARVEHFSGDDDWITADQFVSVRNADGYSVALNWILFPMVRIIGDFTYTDYSDPIRVQVHPDGTVDYVNREKVFTLRLGMDF